MLIHATNVVLETQWLGEVEESTISFNSYFLTIFQIQAFITGRTALRAYEQTVERAEIQLQKP